MIIIKDRYSILHRKKDREKDNSNGLCKKAVLKVTILYFAFFLIWKMLQSPFLATCAHASILTQARDMIGSLRMKMHSLMFTAAYLTSPRAGLMLFIPSPKRFVSWLTAAFYLLESFAFIGVILLKCHCFRSFTLKARKQMIYQMERSEVFVNY